MKKFEIKRIFVDDEALHVITTEHEYVDQLHVCEDGSMRRANPADDDAADCLGFIDDDDSNNFSDDDSKEFMLIMNRAWDELEATGKLDSDGCIPREK